MSDVLNATISCSKKSQSIPLYRQLLATGFPKVNTKYQEF